MNALTWTCHFCHDERPDSKIDVVSHLSRLPGRVEMKQNRRYCNDRARCRQDAAYWLDRRIAETQNAGGRT